MPAHALRHGWSPTHTAAAIEPVVVTKTYHSFEALAFNAMLPVKLSCRTKSGETNDVPVGFGVACTTKAAGSSRGGVVASLCGTTEKVA